MKNAVFWYHPSTEYSECALKTEEDSDEGEDKTSQWISKWHRKRKYISIHQKHQRSHPEKKKLEKRDGQHSSVRHIKIIIIILIIIIIIHVFFFVLNYV